MFLITQSASFDRLIKILRTIDRLVCAVGVHVKSLILAENTDKPCYIGH